MQQGGTRARLLRVRPARARGRAARRPPAAPSGSERLEKLLDRRNRTVRLSETFDDGDALYEAAKQQELEGIMAKRARLAVLRGQAHARLAEDQDARPAGVPHRRLHARRRPARVDLRLADPRACARAASCSTSATSARASTTPRSAGCSRSSSRCVARQSPFRPVPKMPRVRKDRDRVGRAAARRRGRVRASSRTTAACARPSYQGLREDKGADEVQREEPPSRSRRTIRKGSRELKLSNLDKPFWPEEGITKGDLLALLPRRSRRCSCRT